MLKKNWVILLSIIMSITLLLGCSLKKSTNIKDEKKKPTSHYKFGVLMDKYGQSNEEFNNSINNGLKKVEEKLKSQIQVLEANSSEQYESKLKELIKGNDLTFATGFKMKEMVDKVAKDNPQKNFIILDEIIDLPNVKSIIYKNEEGAFLMGVIAGKMTKSNKVGFIGGIDTEATEKFEIGYIAGVKAVNPVAAQDLMSRKTVRYIGEFNNSKKGYDLAKSLYSSDVDIIFHASGITGEGIFKAAEEMNKYAIGVDIDQYSEFPQYEDVIISSLIKNVDRAIYETCEQYIEGAFRSGKINVLKLGLKDDWLEVASTTSKHVKTEVIDLVNNYKNDIINEKIKIPESLDEVRGTKY